MGVPNYPEYNADKYPIATIQELCIGIINTEWNPDIMEKLTHSCTEALLDAGIDTSHIHVATVPGSFELPLGAKMMLGSTHKIDAVICLGCVIQGETKHDDYINHTIARAISQLGLISGKPVIFGVLTTNNMEQANARAGGALGNKGKESAHVALKMLSLKQKLSNTGSKISF